MSELSPATPGTTFRLMYRSRNRVADQDKEAELTDIFARARSYNAARDVTGALLLSGQWFVQVLEGAEPEVQTLFARIDADPRHDDVELLSAGPADERAFAHWSMARVSLADSYIPLIAQISEISPEGYQRGTADKARLLDAMREAVTESP